MRSLVTLPPQLRWQLLGHQARTATAWQLAPGPPLLCRGISEEQLHASPDQVADLFNRSVENRRVRAPSPGEASPLVCTTRREAMSLYREILRYSNLLVWRDQQGRVWRDVIRTSARQEFDQARFERDPELVNKLIITGRDAVQRTVEAFMRKRQQIQAEEEAGLGQGPKAPS